MIDIQLIFPLYLFYGMAFFAIGVSITSRDTSVSSLMIARPLRYFSLFAYSHALLEWYTLYLILYSAVFSVAVLPWINFTKLVLVTVSFGFLLQFGISLLRRAYPGGRNWFFLIPLLLVILVFVSLPLHDNFLSGFPFGTADIRIRYLIGFPSALIASFSLVLYSRTVRHISRKGALNFAGAGFALACYGILTGIVPSGSMLPMINTPVELLRGISAFVILYFVMNALHTFDVERKMVIEERLQRFAKAEKLSSLGKLAFGVAHEINNPLTNVSLTVELLKGELGKTGELSDPRAKRFATIERNLGRASKIASELLFFSTDKDTDYQPADLNELINGTLELLGARRKDYQIELKLQPLPLISVIPWKVEEVFLNVLSNAIEVLDDNGIIQIESQVETDQILVRITDNGPGIAGADLPFVLDPFFTTKEVGKGTGLGLSICFGIMEMHGGKIEVVNSPDQGTEVSLTFQAKEGDYD